MKMHLKRTEMRLQLFSGWIKNSVVFYSSLRGRTHTTNSASSLEGAVLKAPSKNIKYLSKKVN